MLSLIFDFLGKTSYWTSFGIYISRYIVNICNICILRALFSWICFCKPITLHLENWISPSHWQDIICSRISFWPQSSQASSTSSLPSLLDIISWRISICGPVSPLRSSEIFSPQWQDFISPRICICLSTPRSLNFSIPLAEFHQLKILNMWACLSPIRNVVSSISLMASIISF